MEAMTPVALDAALAVQQELETRPAPECRKTNPAAR